MIEPMAVFLLIVFTIHLAIFLRLSLRHRKTHHYLAVATFILLLASTIIKMAWPQLHIFAYSLHALFRYSAWVTTAALIVAYFIQRRRK